MNAEAMKQRTKDFAKHINRLCRTLPNSRRLANRGSNIPGPAHRLHNYWLELMVETDMVKLPKLKLLLHECDELVSMFVASLNTAKR